MDVGRLSGATVYESSERTGEQFSDTMNPISQRLKQRQLYHMRCTLKVGWLMTLWGRALVQVFDGANYPEPRLYKNRRVLRAAVDFHARAYFLIIPLEPVPTPYRTATRIIEAAKRLRLAMAGCASTPPGLEWGLRT